MPSYDVLIKIARVLRVSTDNLLGYSNKSVIDVTGLTQKQINTLQEITVTFQRHNILYRKMMEDDSVVNTLIAMGLVSEDDDWLK